MPLLNLVEAANKLGFSTDLLLSLCKKCPKRGESRTLPSTKMGDALVFQESDIMDYRRYLSAPWPKPKKGTRAEVPTEIQNDIRQESHFECAICGRSNNGEIAHIDPWCKTFNNSPDNLIFLCPNHHTEFDYGFAPNANINKEVILSAKRMKRDSRRRMLLHEKNLEQLFAALLGIAKSLEKKLESTKNADEQQAIITETKHIINELPRLTNEAKKLAKGDMSASGTVAKIFAMAPSIEAAIGDMTVAKLSQQSIKSAAKSVTASAEKYEFNLDDTPCPHCGGCGTRGLQGSICSYCGGDCLISKEKADEFDPETIDERECPHCSGSGRYGLSGTLCVFCEGDTYVSERKLDTYSKDNIDEVECPRCGGSGREGIGGDFCLYCHGDQWITKKKMEKYDPDTIDAVECPHCSGNRRYGQGLVCVFCGGSCSVPSTKASAYDPKEIDEATCPHCGGRGHTGRSFKTCQVCGGDSVISRAKHAAYIKRYGSQEAE